MGLDLTDVRKFENLEFLAKELVEGFITGLHRSPYHGFSVEFAEHKLYNYGESTKNIDWKVFAKTDRLYTKQYEEETNLRCSILIDTSSSMYYPKPDYDKIKFSIYATAALCFLMVKQRDAVGITAFANEILTQTVQKSTRLHLNQLLQTLSDWLKSDNPEKQHSNIAENIHLVADKIQKRSLVIIFTDMFQQGDSQNAVFEALQHLKHNKHEVLLFHVTDVRTERNFEFADRPYKFIDKETKDTITLTPTFIKQQYKTRMDDFYKSIKLACGQLKIDLVEVDIADSFDKVLSAYLIKRKRMR